jgi:hypothetical protein
VFIGVNLWLVFLFAVADPRWSIVAEKYHGCVRVNSGPIKPHCFLKYFRDAPFICGFAPSRDSFGFADHAAHCGSSALIVSRENL